MIHVFHDYKDFAACRDSDDSLETAPTIVACSKISALFRASRNIIKLLKRTLQPFNLACSQPMYASIALFALLSPGYKSIIISEMRLKSSSISFLK